METTVISYNLKERGRYHTGQPRNFDIPRIAAAVNCAATQERVKNRDMIGFYGHWPRIKFGMHPAEGGLEKGKSQAVEPALITTLLKAYPDGTIQHQAEFLPTQAGEIAAKLYSARTGGFSSAIDQNKPEFFGFDYVLEPNFTTNRGYSLDSVFCEGGACAIGMDCDSVNAAILEEQLAAMAMLLDAANAGQTIAAQTLDAVTNENAALKKQLKKIQQERKTFDDAKRRPLVVNSKPIQRMALDTAAFLALPTLPMPTTRSGVVMKEDPAIARFMQRIMG